MQLQERAFPSGILSLVDVLDISYFLSVRARTEGRIRLNRWQGVWFVLKIEGRGGVIGGGGGGGRGNRAREDVCGGGRGAAHFYALELPPSQ